MNKKYVSAFSDAILNVLPQLGIEEVTQGDVRECGKNIDTSGVVCIVGIIGDLTGNIIFSMSEEDAKGVASAMMGGMELDGFDEIAQSAVSELSNMLSANASMNLSELGLNTDISTPTLMQGIFTMSGSYDNYTCIEMNAGALKLDVYVSLGPKA
jgi:Predicted inhibitor of MCP methylation, homolog of CheC